MLETDAIEPSGEAGIMDLFGPAMDLRGVPSAPRRGAAEPRDSVDVKPDVVAAFLDPDRFTP